jgi:hypothetical protein
MRIVATIGVALALALPGWAAQPRRATLKLETVAPLVVRGVNFGAREQVAVIAATPAGQRIVNIRARSNGRFVAAFGLSLERCAPLTIRAIGSLGSRAILQVEPRCKKRGKALSLAALL